MATTAKVDGTDYELVHVFNPNRGIVNMEGAYILVDREDEERWTASGKPVREDEKAILNTFIATIENSTTVTAPDGTVTTFNHEGGSAKR